MQRWRGLLIGAVFAVIAVVLSLSDRVPKVFRRVSDVGGAAVRRFQVAFGFDSPVGRDEIPWSSDELAHLALWGGGMLVIGLLLRRRRHADRIAAMLFVSSVVLEVLQAFVTTNRSLSLGDASANGLGILCGLVVVVLVDAAVPARRPGLDQQRV